MSNNQTDMALKMIENAQKELGYDFHIADFRRLIEAQDKSSESINTNANYRDFFRELDDFWRYSKDKISNWT